MTAIFISHSSKDNAAAAEMKAWLEAQGHTSLFLDFDPEAGIKGGSAWKQTLYQQLRQCQAVIALLTPSWLASKWCFAELVLAQERGKAIFPVKVEPCAARGVFSDIQAIDLTGDPEEGYRRLQIGLLERGLDPQDVFDWDPKRPPYPGLLAFQEQDAAIFFGRGEDILKTLETLDALRRQGREAARFALLLGASGSGKSSLARAGVIPRLKKKPAEWLPLPPFRPQQEPLDELAVALAAAFEAHGRPRDWSVIRTALHAAAAQNPVDGLALLKLARDLAIVVKQPETTVLLTIDQAEELFGYSPSEAATRFLRLLRAALEAADRQLMAVATLRSDFLGEFQSHSVLQDSEYPHHFRYRAVPVDPMPLRNFHAIIQGPARLAGVQLDDGLVETIVQDTGTRDALPLLAFTLRRLYERYGGDGHLSVDEYESLGRLEGAIREEAQRVIAEADPNPEELEALHAAFVPTMVRINAEGGYARRRARFDELPRRALPLLRRFVDARLLVTDRDPQNRETIEVAHEALLRTWPQLGIWLAEDQDKLRLLESLQRAAEEWDQGGRRDDLLIHRDGRLKDAEALRANPRFTLPEASVERAYLDACGAAQFAREAAEKEEQERRIRDAERIAEEEKKAAAAQKRTARATLVGLGVAVLVAGLAGWQYFEATRQRQLAQQRQKEAEAQNLAVQSDLAFKTSGRYLERSALLAVESMRRVPAVEGDGALRQSLSLLPKELIRHQGYVYRGSLSPDFRYLAIKTFWLETLSNGISRTAQGTAVVETTTGKELLRVTHEGDVEGDVNVVAFSPDGRYLATGGGSSFLKQGIARVVETTTGKELVLVTYEDPVVALAFSPDGRYLATGSGGGLARHGIAQVVETTTGKELIRVTHEDPVVALAFSPDGRYLVTGSGGGLARHGIARVVETTTGKELIRRVSFGVGGVNALAFSPDGRYLAIGSGDNTAVVVETTTGEELFRVTHEGAVVALAFSPDGRYLATGSGDNTASVVETTTGKELIRVTHEGDVNAVAFSPDGRYLATGGANARVVETPTGEELIRVIPHDWYVTALAFSPDGRYLATGSGDRTARVVETTTGKELLRVTHELHEHAVTALAFNPDGRYLATGSAGYNDEHAIARVVETSTGKELIRITHEDSVRRPVRRRSTRLNEVALGPDGRYLATGSEDKTARVVETTTGKELIRVTYKNPVYALAFSPDGRYLAIGSINDNRVVETTTGEELIRVTHEDSVNAVAVTAVAFSPDGRYLAIGSGDNTAVVVETTTGEELFRVTHEGAVVALAFSPDGRYLATGSEDNTVRVVETTTGKEIIRLPHEDDVRAVAFSLDGGVLYTGTVKEKVATLLRHLLRAEDLIAATCARLTRNLTAEEWKQYLGDTPYRMTCLDLPGPDDAPQASALQPPPGAGKAPSAEPASTPTKAPGPAVTAPPAIQPQPEQPTAPAPVQ